MSKNLLNSYSCLLIKVLMSFLRCSTSLLVSFAISKISFINLSHCWCKEATPIFLCTQHCRILKTDESDRALVRLFEETEPILKKITFQYIGKKVIYTN